MITERTFRINSSEFRFITEEKRQGKLPILFLHGFTGSAEDWTSFFNKLHKSVYPVALDLPGHGKSIKLEDEFYRFHSVNLIVNKLIEYLKLEKPIILGYSMGGRVAYNFAVSNPQKLRALIIESSTPGIAEREIAEERLKKDFELAQLLDEKGINWFIEYWFSQPIFNTLNNLPEEKLKAIKNMRTGNSSTELAKSLRNYGQGKVGHVWDKIGKIDFPLLLIDGELDKKYRFLNTLVMKYTRTAIRKTIKNSGHNTHLEKPEDFIILVNSFIEKIIKGK